jgi:heme/copper-type cytochrome/quinol oxidase subunit 3
VRDINDGRLYLPDAQEGRREGLITSVLDAKPEQVLRVSGTSYVPIVSAVMLAGVFVALTFKWWTVTAAFSVASLAAFICWLWTGTAEIPEKPEKDAGLGLTLPLYMSGSASVGWWGMFITMVGDSTAFASLVFGYFFYWTIHADFTAGAEGPDVFWPMIATGLFVAAWMLMLLARGFNSASRVGLFRASLIASSAVNIAAAAAGLAGPWLTEMDPTAHVYPAIVWVLVLWVAAHAAVGTIMQLYCLARSFAGRLTATHDMDIRNVVLFWHFLTLTAAITFVVIGLFPEAAR